MIPLLDAEARKTHKQHNDLHSVALLGGLAALLGLSMWLLAGWLGVLWAATAVAIVFAVAPRVPPGTVMRMYRAREVSNQWGGQLAQILDTLTERAELKHRPRLYVVPSMTLNAFATGSRDHAAIAVTEGLVRRLSMREIAGVVAHEISHIRNNDLWVMGLADVISRLTQGLAYVAVFLAAMNVFGMLSGERYASWGAILLFYLAPTLSSLLQLGLSRAREYDADLEGAMLTGDPRGLASALRQLEQHTGNFWEDLMFPVPGRRVPQPSVLRSHPDTGDRIERLLALEGQPTRPPILVVEQPMISMLGAGPIEMRPRYRFPGLWF